MSDFRSSPRAESTSAPIWATLILQLYRRSRNDPFKHRLREWITRLEGGPGRSATVRRIFQQFHRVTIGYYTTGPCMCMPQLYHPGTVFGRYCAVSPTVRTFTRNHPMNIKSTHGFFENAALGKVKKDLMNFGTLEIGHGAWLGENVIIVTPTQRIGEGAVVTAGSVVYGNVPPYSIVSGFPARVIRYRHSKEVIAELLASKWWEKTPEELEKNRDAYLALQEPKPVSASEGSGVHAFA